MVRSAWRRYGSSVHGAGGHPSGERPVGSATGGRTSGTLTSPPPAPEKISDLPEDGTLAFQLTIDDGPSAFLMGASDFSERDATGLRPDVAMIATPGSPSTHHYVPRLREGPGQPRHRRPGPLGQLHAP
ncbi:hypothetical protein [Streptomyces sp. NPDC005336]|uniref:hypothetical protein n=1 Tax=Streptomyces sp. NPDC005336 TaxID=3157035 RepID=UPI0033B80315